MAEEKSPRDLDRTPEAVSEKAPAHEKVGEHGIRTTAQVDVRDPETGVTEARQEAYLEAQAEDFERSKRSFGAGPNPYTMQSVRAKHGAEDDLLEKAVEYFGGYHMGDSAQTVAQYLTYLESRAESDADDAEVPVMGDTLTDTGQKIQLSPDRVAADEKAVLPNVMERHRGLIDEIQGEEGRGATSEQQIAAHGEAQGTFEEHDGLVSSDYLGPPHPEGRRAGEEYDGSEAGEDTSSTSSSEVTEDSEAR